ncbi:MAG: PepSY-associated TM helix domain-containing protein [Pseudomonadota bacterium]
MKQTTNKKLYEVHSWVGSITAILMFIIAFTGAVSVFGDELKVWSQSGLHRAQDISEQQIESLALGHLQTIPTDYHKHLQITPPHIGNVPYLVFLFEAETPETPEGEQPDPDFKPYMAFLHDPETLALVDQRAGTREEVLPFHSRDMSDFITFFHADLHLGNPWGLIVTGLLGLTLLASTITGVVIHRKIIAEMFAFRARRSLRLMYADLHKVIGVWGMLFHAIIGFTGAFLGLAFVVMLPAAAYVSFGGDQDKLIETFLPETAPEISGEYAQPQIANTLEFVAEQQDGDLLVFNLFGGTDKNALIEVITASDSENLNVRTHKFTAADGQFVESYGELEQLGGAAKVLDLIVPLHFGNFGGIAIKVLWAVLGLSTAFLAISGMMVWVERRTFGSKGNLSIKAYRRLSRLNIGACGGVVVAVMALFPLQRILQDALGQPTTSLGWAFFIIWFACIFWSMLRDNDYLTLRQLVYATAAICISVAPINGLVTGNHLFNVLTHGHWTVAIINAFLLLTGVLLMRIGARMPSQRPERLKDVATKQQKISAEAMAVPET